MSNSKPYVLDTWKNKPLMIEVKQNDSDRTLVFDLKAAGLPIDLTGKTIQYYVEKTDSTVVYNSGSVIDAVTGTAGCKLTAQSLSVAGTQKLEISIIGSGGTETTFTVYLIVTAGIDQSGAVQSSSEFGALVQGLSDINSVKTQLSGKANQTDLNSTNTQLASKVNQSDLNTTNSNLSTLGKLKGVNRPNIIHKTNFIDSNSIVSYGIPAVTGSATTTGTTRFQDIPIKNDGYLVKFQLYGMTAGQIKLKTLTKNGDNTFNVVKDVATLTLSTGINTFYGGIDFENQWMLKGSYVGIFLVSGQIAYAPSGTSWNFVGEASGSNITIGTSAATLNINFDINEALNIVNYGNPAITGSAVSLGTTRFANVSTANGGYLNKFQLYGITAGSIKVKAMLMNSDGTFSVDKEIGTFTIATGVNLFTAGVHFTKQYLKKGTFLAVYGGTGQLAYTGTGPSYSYAGEAVGSNLTISTSPVTLSLNFDVDEYKFKSDWSVSSGFFVDMGLGINSNGAWNTCAYWNKDTKLDRVVTRMRVAINNVTSKFAVVRKPNGLIAGTVAEVDCSLKKLNIYNLWDGSATKPIVIKTSDIAFNFVAGREYLVDLLKLDGYNKLTITDCITQQSSYVDYDNGLVNEANSAGSQWGSPGIMFESGDIVVTKFEYVSLMPKNSRVLTMGDSINEGNSLRGLAGDYDNRWNYKIFQYLNGNAAISGQGGADSLNLLQRLDVDLDSFKADYVVVMIGTNDTSYSSWLINIGSIITRIKNTGAIPVLCTLPPRSGFQTTINSINAWVKSSGYDYINFAKCLTLNADELTQDPSLFMADAVHPNVAGHQKMYQQVMIDMPEIFD